MVNYWHSQLLPPRYDSCSYQSWSPHVTILTLNEVPECLATLVILFRQCAVEMWSKINTTPTNKSKERFKIQMAEAFPSRSPSLLRCYTEKLGCKSYTSNILTWPHLAVQVSIPVPVSWSLWWHWSLRCWALGAIASPFCEGDVGLSSGPLDHFWAFSAGWFVNQQVATSLDFINHKQRNRFRMWNPEDAFTCHVPSVFSKAACLSIRF